MTFSPKAFGVFLAFVGILLLAVNARAGHIDMRFAVVGLAAILLIELLVIFGPALWGGTRDRNGVTRG